MAAELDPKVLQNFEKTLENMNSTLQGMEQILKGVKGGIDKTFNPEIIKSWRNAMHGLKAETIIDVEKNNRNINDVKQQIRLLKQELKGEQGLRVFTPEELEREKRELAELKPYIAELKRMRNKGTISEADSNWLKYIENKQKGFEFGGSFSIPLNEEDMRRKIDLLAKFRMEYNEMMKGSKQRAIELANIQKAENKGQNQEYNRAVREQVQYQKQLNSLRKEYNTLATKKNRSNEENNLLEQTKQKIKDIILLMRQKNNEQKGSYNLGRQLTEYDRIKNKLREINEEHGHHEEHLGKITHSLQHLAGAFGIAFSLHGLVHFGKELVKVRGEYEMQQVALRSILQNRQRADEIFEKTMHAALHSPYTSEQLVKYTKQLAAYRIETSKLYNTTQMLADVSAGLGVDMQRLILAYGQVKAANYLRASEIRQFTEAGVNILGELSSYFSEMKGEAISTAQVMDMVQKRMVKFEDVEVIFQRMTGKGGIFYNMQEVMSQTVEGQLRKIKDAYDHMLNDIGKSQEGLIRGIIGIIRNIISNWRLWLSVIESVSAAFLAFKATNAISHLLGIGKAANAAAASTSKLSTAFKNLGKSFATNWPALAIAAVVAAATALIAATKRMKEFNEEVDKQALVLYDDQQKLESYQQRIEKNNEILRTAERGSEQYNAALKENAGILASMKNEYAEIADGLEQNANGEVILTQRIDSHNESLKEQIRLNELLKQSSPFDEGFAKDSSDYFEQLEEWSKKITKVQQELKLKKLRGQVSEEEMPFVNQILGIDAKDMPNAVNEYNNIISNVQRLVSNQMGNLRETYTNAIREVQSAQMDAYSRQQTINQLQVKLFTQNLREEALGNLNLGNIVNLSGIKTNTHNVREFKKESDPVIQELLKSFELGVRSIDSEQKKIEETYNGNFAKYLSENGELLKEKVLKNEADVNETVRTFLEQNGHALTEENKKVWNELLNEAVFGAERRNQIYALEMKKRLAFTEFERQEIERQIEELKNTNYDFFAQFTPQTEGGEGLGDGQTQRSFDELLSLLKTMNSEYNKLSKSAYGYAKSQGTVMTLFRESFKDIFKTTQGLNKLDDVLTMLDFSKLDITSKSGLASAFKELYAFLEKNDLWGNFGKDADKLRAKLQKTIDEQEVEIGVDVQIRARENFGREIEKMFGDYELTLELQGLNIPQDVAKDLLDFDYTSLSEVTKKLSDWRNQMLSEDNFDEEDMKLYESWMKKVTDKVYAMRKERAKQYTKYLEQELSERAKLEMQYTSDVAFVKANFKEGTQKDAILHNLEDNYNSAINELQWKSFKESDFYVEMMQDLTSMPSEYLEMMKGKLDEWVKKADVLSPKALKEVLRAREKIIETQVAMSPIKALGTSIERMELFQKSGRKDVNDQDISQNYKESRKQLEGIILKREKLIETKRQEIEQEEALLGKLTAQENIQRTINELAQQGITTLPDGTEISATSPIQAIKQAIELEKGKLSSYTSERITQNIGESDEAFEKRKQQYDEEILKIQTTLALLQDLKTNREEADAAGVDLSQPVGGDKTKAQANVIKLKKEYDKLLKEQASDQETNEAFKAYNKAIHGLASNTQTVLGHVKNLKSSFKTMLEATGTETDAVTELWSNFGDTMIDSMTNALNLIPALITGYTAAGVAINTSMGIIGLIAEAIQLTISLITFLAQLSDAQKDKEIEEQQHKIDALKDAYGRLEKQIEKTWSTMKYMDTYEKQIDNLNKQIEALEAQRTAEQSKKDSDTDKVNDYNKSIQDAKDELEELKQKQIEVFGGLGETNYRSAAEEFVSAWKDAFLETGDGLSGLQEHFNEFLQEWFVKQATMRIAGRMLEPLFKDIDKAVDQYSGGGANVMMSELAAAKEKFAAIAPQLSDALEALAGQWDLSGEGGLSGLAASIQGMTEEQANILEAYWNSVRMYTASIDENVSRIAAILGAGGVDTNPQLQQLELIARHTQNIHDLLSSTILSGHSKGGKGIRVFVE